MSGKEPTKRRATGPEKSQERPTHTSLTTFKEQVQTMQEQQSSDINNADTDDIDNTDIDNIANIDNIGNIEREPPFVDVLTTPFAQPIVKQHAATLRRLQEQEREIQRQQQQIHDLEYEAHLKEAHHQNLLQGAQISSRPSSVSPSTRGPTPQRQFTAQELDIVQQEQEIASLILTLESKKSEYAQMKRAVSPDPRLPIETPGPHRLQPRPERPEDLAFKQKLRAQEQAEQATEATTPTTADSQQDAIMNVFKSLTKVLSDNNKHLNSNDVSDPPKFLGSDSHWDDWYLQWRTYLEAKGWLATFEHPTGPGTIGFDNEINKKIYNKLLTLCQKGTAATYITKAANFNGWEAAKYLLGRYEGFSKQRQRSLRQLVESIRHVHGTPISRHVDKFERICGQMAHNNPTKPPTEEQKIDWFLDSVTEKTYDSVHANCTMNLLEGDLTFAKVIKLYTHRCFQRYPHFQVDDLDSTPKTVTNNSTHVQHNPRNTRDKGRGRHNNGRGRGNPRSTGSRPSRSSSRDTDRRPKGKGKGHGRQKGKGKGKSPSTASGQRNPKARDPCAYCGGGNHDARTCYKRIADEKLKTPKTHKQAIQNILIDEAAMEFSQTVLSVVITRDPLPAESHTITWGETNQETTTDSDGTNAEQENEDNSETQQNDDSEKYSKQREDTLTTDKGNSPTMQHMLIHEQKPTTPLPTIEPLSYSLESELTGVPMTASMTPNDEQGSSSVEPGWGRIESSKEREREEGLRLWESINVGGYSNQRTTKAYRHGRCYMCSKPVSTTNLDPELELFCEECDQELMDLNCGYRSGEREDNMTKRGLEKTERDDEEEWGRVPIPQSDDSDSAEGWLSDESDDHDTHSTKETKDKAQEYRNCVVAFMVAPRKDGRILTKEGNIIDVNEPLPIRATKQHTQSTCGRRSSCTSSMNTPPHGLPEKPTTKKLRGLDNTAQS